MAARSDTLGGGAAQDAGHVAGAEALADAGHARQYLAGDGHRGGHRLELAEAVVAGAALVLGQGLTEVADQVAVPAADAGRVALHVAQQRRAAGR